MLASLLRRDLLCNRAAQIRKLAPQVSIISVSEAGCDPMGRNWPLLSFDGFEEFRQMPRRDVKAGGMITAPAVQFRRGQHDLTLGAALQRCEALRVTLQPLLSHKRVCRSGVERIVTDGDNLPFDLTKSVAPVIDVVDLHSSRHHHLSRSLGGRGQRQHHEFVVIGDHPMNARAAAGQTDSKRVTRTPPKRRMGERVVNLVEIFRQSSMQVCQRPCCESFRVHSLGDLPDITRNLRVAFQVVNELGVRRSE
jgi:hypothetical protein